jgi:putative SOS response-associated peptidase YedK
LVHAFLRVSTDPVDVVRLNAEGKRELVSMRWGLVPISGKFRVSQPEARHERSKSITQGSPSKFP